MQTDKDLLALMSRDHVSVTTLFEDASKRSEASRHEIYLRIRTLLYSHLRAEEEIVYPLLAVDKGGGSLQENYVSEHSRIRELLGVLDSILPDHADWERYFGALKSHALDHFLKEERQLYPRLRAALSEDRLIELSGKFQHAKERHQAPATAA